MSEWREIELGDAPLQIIDGDRGKNYPSQGDFLAQGDCLFLSTKNVRPTGFDFSECQFISYERDNLLNKGRLQRNDVVLTTSGTIGNVAFYDSTVKYDRIRINSGMLIIRPDLEYLDPKFNFYIFRHLKKEIDNVISGSAQPQLPIKDLIHVSILLPSIDEQHTIASVLTTLDDKIDLLHRQNATLEAMAEALFRQWFVVEAKDEWEEVQLGKFIKCISGASYKGEFLKPSNNALVTLKCFNRNGRFSSDGFKQYTGDYKLSQIVKSKDIIVAHTDITQNADIIGNAVMVEDDGEFENLIITMDIVKVEITHTIIKEYLFYLLKSIEFKEYCVGCSNGSTVLHLNKKALPEFIFSLPPVEKMRDFAHMAEKFISKRFANTSQIRTLEKLRDTLLPKLMSGEVRVRLDAEAPGPQRLPFP